MTTQLFNVPVTGIGKGDYTQAIEFASEATMRGHQMRIVWGGHWANLPTIPFPFAYSALLPFYDSVTGTDIDYAPDIPHHIQSVLITTERKALVPIGLYRYASYADYLLGIIEVWYGDMFGYGRAEIHYSKGIKTEPGKVYCVFLAEYSEQPTFTASLTVTALAEEVIYG